MTPVLVAGLTGLAVGAIVGVWTGGAGRVWRMVFAEYVQRKGGSVE